MGNYKVIEFENSIGLASRDAMAIIKSNISTKIDELILLEEYDNITGHWGIKYSLKNVIIFIQSDYGDLNVFLYHNEIETTLKAIDELMENVIVASKKNIEYMLSSLNKVVKTIQFLSM